MNDVTDAQSAFHLGGNSSLEVVSMPVKACGRSVRNLNKLNSDFPDFLTSILGQLFRSVATGLSFFDKEAEAPRDESPRDRQTDVIEGLSPIHEFT